MESYDSYDKDENYSSSVVLTLVLVKELMKSGNSEEQAFKLVYKEFLLQNPSDQNWKSIF